MDCVEALDVTVPHCDLDDDFGKLWNELMAHYGALASENLPQPFQAFTKTPACIL